jgi:hypothetical protein
MEAQEPWYDLTPISHHDVTHTATAIGATATVLPNLLSAQIQAHAQLILDGTGRTDQSMAATRYTSGWRSQKLNAHCILRRREDCSHWIRRRTATPPGHLFFSASSFSSFTINHNYNLSPLLGNYKRGGKNHT